MVSAIGIFLSYLIPIGEIWQRMRAFVLPAPIHDNEFDNRTLSLIVIISMVFLLLNILFSYHPFDEDVEDHPLENCERPMMS